MKTFWADDSGAILTIEWIFVATIMVLALVTGLKTVQGAVLNELEELAGAIGALSQTYSIGGNSGCCGFVNGSRFTDTTNTFPIDTCTEGADATGPACPD